MLPTRDRLLNILLFLGTNKYAVILLHEQIYSYSICCRTVTFNPYR